jgi:hypothetical protein
MEKRLHADLGNGNSFPFFNIAVLKALKYGFTFLLAVFIILNLLCSPVAAVIHGDLNDDGRVDVQDVVIAMRHSLGLEALNDLQNFLADVNSDGKVNVQDVSQIMQKSLGLIEGFSDLSLSETGLIKEFVAGDGISPGNKLVAVTLDVTNQNDYRVFVGSTALTFSETLGGFFGEVAEADAVQQKAAVFRK